MSGGRQFERHMERHATSVHLAFIHRTDIYNFSSETVYSLLQTLIVDPFVRECILDRGCLTMLETTRITQARNKVVDEFLAHPRKPQWLLMIDPDMGFPPNAVRSLIAAADSHSRPIIGGLCFGGKRLDDQFPVIWRLVDAGEGQARPEIITDWPEGQIVNVDATGAAFLLVHRGVFERMATKYPRPYPWFADTFIGTSEIGEDTTFCLRARHMGIPVAVHTGVRITHVKTATLDIDSWRAHHAPQADGPSSTEAEAEAGAAGVSDGAVPAGHR